VNSVQATVIKSTGSWYVVKTDEGRELECRIRGKIRLDDLNTTNPVAVGDRVRLNTAQGDTVIEEVLPRENYIIRQSPKHRYAYQILAANIDQAFLIVTQIQPRTAPGFINRFLLTAEAYHIAVTLLFNKQDVLEKAKDLKKQDALIATYRDLGYPVYKIIAHHPETLREVEELMRSKTTLVAGHSGSGKSTFINSLHPRLNLKTDNLAKHTAKGKHTTTFAEMFELPFGGRIIDTPGVKEFGIIDLEAAEASHYFIEMRDRLSGCRFHNCLHLNEPGCAIIEAVEAGEIAESRYKSYVRIVEELEEKREY